MADIAAQAEEGHLPKAEKPMSFHKGQLGKGVPVGGKVTAQKGSELPIDDAHIKKLKKEWAKAHNANEKFPPF